MLKISGITDYFTAGPAAQQNMARTMRTNAIDVALRSLANVEGDPAIQQIVTQLNQLKML